MTAPRLSNIVRLTGVPLEEITLAIAGEFKPVRFERARAQLDLFASAVDERAVDNPERRAEGLLEVLGTDAGFAVEGDRHPSSLMLDEVLERRGGHPLMLVVVYAAVARRAGFDLYPVGNSNTVLLGDPEPTPALAIDPVPGGRRPPADLRWICPHVVALRVLEAIGARFLNRGDLAGAIRAAELRMLLPLDRATRERSEITLLGLRARLN